MITSVFLRKEKTWAFLCLFFGILFANAQTPLVLYTGLTATTPSPSSSRFNLNSLSGTFKQVRFQSNQTASASSLGWAFHIGTPASASYTNNWRPYTSGNTLSVNTYIPTSFANGARFNSGGGSDGLLPAITNGNYYTFNVSNNTGDNVMQLLETGYNPVSVTAVTAASGSYGSRNVSITTSATPNAAEYIYVRYSTNSYTSSTIVQATGSGTSWSASIPWQSSAVSYYVYTSNKTLSQINSDVTTYGQTAHDMSTLNLNNASGSNYAWTPATGNFIVTSTGGSFATSVGYASLTNASGVFAALNTATAGTGAVTILQTGDSTAEAGTNSLTASSNWTSVVLNPQGARTISGTVNSNPMIDLNGADNVTINGLNTSGNSLTISNLSTSAAGGTSTIRFIADATNNIVNNCTVLGSGTVPATTNGGTIFFSTSTTTGNDNNTISNCNIGPAGTNLPSKAIYGNGSTASTARANSGINISNNNIYDYFLSGAHAAIYTNDGNTDWTISNNRFYQTAGRTLASATNSVIFINGSTVLNNNNLISGNVIGFANSAGTGNYSLVFSASTVFIPINISAAGTTTATSIQGNTIAGITMSGNASGTSTAAPFRAIYI